MIGDFPAILVEYGYQLQGYPVRATQHIILLGDKALIVTCTALDDTFEAHRADFEGAINSLTLIEDE